MTMIEQSRLEDGYMRLERKHGVSWADACSYFERLFWISEIPFHWADLASI